MDHHGSRGEFPLLEGGQTSQHHWSKHHWLLGWPYSGSPLNCGNDCKELSSTGK